MGGIREHGSQFVSLHAAAAAKDRVVEILQAASLSAEEVRSQEGCGNVRCFLCESIVMLEKGKHTNTRTDTQLDTSARAD